MKYMHTEKTAVATDHGILGMINLLFQCLQRTKKTREDAD